MLGGRLPRYRGRQAGEVAIMYATARALVLVDVEIDGLRKKSASKYQPRLANFFISWDGQELLPTYREAIKIVIL